MPQCTRSSGSLPDPIPNGMASPSPDPRLERDVRVAAAYYDGYAAEYDAAVDGEESNTRLRAAFQQRVAAAAAPGGTIVDFGCGTGTDARWYASRGYHVIAYDISVAMLGVLGQRCAREVESGAVVAVSGELPALSTALRGERPVAAIAANFAALNHVAELGPLFGALAPQLPRGGAVVASLLNPTAIADMRSSWWWRGLARSPRTGSIRLDGLVTTYRHLRRSVRLAAWPAFELVEWESTADLADGRRRSALRRRLASAFVFATLRRR